MQLTSLLTAVGLATLAAAQNETRVTGKLGDAKQVRNNPVIGELWRAQFQGTVSGIVTATANSVGVNYTIAVVGLPADKGPYSMFFFCRLPPSMNGITLTFITSRAEYHVHARAVPADGNCTETGGHLDSYLRGDTPACDSTAPQTCEIGDLSGKFGLVPGPSVSKR